MAVAGGGALGFGVLDDLAGSGKRRGLKGHLGALAHGEVTTGSVKLAGLAATGLAGGLLLGGRRSDVLINAALIAGGANLLNLFDLRPGRAVKVAALSAGLIAAGGAAGRTGRRASPRSPRRSAPASRCCRRTWPSGPCSATPAPTRSARCSARRRPARCPGPRGPACWPGSSR